MLHHYYSYFGHCIVYFTALFMFKSCCPIFIFSQQNLPNLAFTAKNLIHPTNFDLIPIVDVQTKQFKCCPRKSQKTYPVY